MAEDKELYDFVLHTITYYGSEALERKEPGSKAKSQAEHICEFIRQRELAYELLHQNGINLFTLKAF